MMFAVGGEVEALLGGRCASSLRRKITWLSEVDRPSSSSPMGSVSDLQTWQGKASIMLLLYNVDSKALEHWPCY